MTKPAKRVKIGTKILFGDLLTAECIGIKDEGLRVFQMHYSRFFIEILEAIRHHATSHLILLKN
jgi:S-adenosylmethionine:tRNA ribosyltransferase-isomerase